MKGEIVPLLTGQEPPPSHIWMVMRPHHALALATAFHADTTRAWHTIGIRVWDTGLGDVYIAFTYKATEKEIADLREFMNDHN